MDIDGDGINDILSGCYSRQDTDMAGLFWVLRGKESGGFDEPVALRGTDGELLIIPGDDVVDRICTRPTAADLDGDGDLDLVVGNFRGTFWLFEGEGRGKLSPEPRLLTLKGGGSMKVPVGHGDPFVVDWDADGDPDVLSGSAQGGVYLFENVGDAGDAVFAERKTLVPPVSLRDGKVELKVEIGEEHFTGPQRATRVYADDVNGDGILDLLIGDQVTVNRVAAGLDEDTARERWAAHQRKVQEALSARDVEALRTLREEGKKIVEKERTGFVWLLCGK